MVCYWSLNDSKSLQVSRTLLSIQADLNNPLVWMVSTCPLISKSSSSFTKPLRINPNAPITIGITVTFMFHSWFSTLATSRFLSVFSLSFFFFFFFTLWSTRTAKSTNRKVFFFCWLSLGLVVWTRLDDLFRSQNPREVSASHSQGQILDCTYSTCSYSQI